MSKGECAVEPATENMKLLLYSDVKAQIIMNGYKTFGEN